MRRDGRAVLIVDHNVKSVASLADRVFAMYVGERVAEGRAAGGDERPDGAPRLSRRSELKTAARPESLEFADKRRRRSSKSRASMCSIERAHGAWRRSSLHVHRGEFVAVVGLNGAGKTTLFNAVSGLAAVFRRHPAPGEVRCAASTAAAIARAGIVQAPEGRDLFTDMTVQRKSRHGRACGSRAPERKPSGSAG